MSPQRDFLFGPAVSRKLALFAGLAEQAIFVGAADGRVEWANDAACRLCGSAREELVGRTLQLFHDDPEAQRAATEHFRDRFQAGERARVQASIRSRQGRERWIDLEVTPIPGDGEAAGGWVAVANDVTKRKRAEAALAESEERYRSMVEHSPEPMAVHSRGRLVYANRAALALLGASSADAVIGRPVFEFLHPDYHRLASERIEKMEQFGDPAAPVIERLLRVDGSPVDVELAATPMLWRGAPAIQLAGHVCEPAPAEDAKVPRLRRPQVDLSSLVLELAPQLEVRIAPRAQVSLDLASNLAGVEGERGPLRDLVTTLVAQAAAALPGGRGGIRVRTGARELDARDLASFVPSEGVGAGRFVTLEVCDDGCALDATMRAGLFDASFPERFPGRGPGLAGALAVARAYGGALRVESGADRSTRIVVGLPATKPPPPKRRVRTARAALRAG
jgi:PAS domain S-box-containing protein